MRPICTVSANPPSQVSELIVHATKSLNEQALEEHLLPMDVEIVRQIPLSYKARQDFYA